MGYLINPNPLANYQKFIISQADIISGSTFLTTDLSTNKFWFVTFATFRLINSTTPYTGFQNIYLRQTGGNSQGYLDLNSIAIPNTIESNYFYTFAYNTQSTPTQFGNYTLGPRYIFELDGTYITGNGDIELHFYYNEITI
jgi:hypothetical protein